jgi:peroxiredoxin
MQLRKACFLLSPLLMLVLVVNFLVFSISGAAAAFKNIKVGDQALPVQLKDLDGNTRTLTDYKSSKVILLFFWATWSERSVRELDELVKIQKDYANKGLTILAINVEKQELKAEDRSRIREVVSAKALPFPVLIDEGLTVYNSYGVIVNPTTALVDASGTVAFDLSGYPTAGAAEIEAAVRKALGIATAEETAAPKRKKSEPNPVAMRHAGMGKRLVDEGLPEKGIAELNHAVEADSLYADARLFLGLARVKEGKDEEAAQWLQKAREIDPAAAGAPLLLALLAARKGQVTDALAGLDAALEAEKKAESEAAAAGFRDEAPELADLDLSGPRALAGEGKNSEAKDGLVKLLTDRLIAMKLSPAPAKKQVSAEEKFKQRVELKSEGKLGGVTMEPQDAAPAPAGTQP